MTLVALLFLSLVLFSSSTKNTTLTQAHCLPDQRHALSQLKQGFKTTDELYFPKTNTTKLHSWNASTDCCKWDGITCDEQTGMVTAVDLSDMWITGKLNLALFNLSSLRYLNLSDNYFDNLILPKTGFERLANLTHLDLSYSGFAGPVPSSVSTLTNLISLKLSYNNFYLHDTGLKTLLNNLTKLQVLALNWVNMSLISKWDEAVFQVGPTLQELSMEDCGLSGNFPEMWITGELNPALFNLSSLRYLNLAGNNFVNISLPQTGFERLANLTHLDLSNSGFAGQVPSSISTLTNLISLDLSSNNFYLQDTGLKPLLNNLTKLQVLALDQVNISLNGNEWGKSVFQISSNLNVLSMADCGLSGNFPEEIFHLTNLTELDLSDNPMLSGQLPEFTKQSFLQYLFLINTNFTGPLPDSIGNLQYLSKLSLYNSNFYGEIPPSIANLTRLEDLELWLNRLTGTIPMSLFSHPSLWYLDLSNNQLSGYLPEFSNGSSILESIYLDSNNLQGELPISIFKFPQLNTLSLESNNFNGTLNLDVIQHSKNLESLFLSNNKLSIIEGKNHNESFYASFPQLNFVGLASCNLTKFPSFLNYLAYISSLDLSNNSLTGEIPLSICNMTYLLLLDLSYNNLTGPVLPCLLEDIELLEVLNLKSNKLNEPLPQNISKACGLKMINLNGNVINGSLPKLLKYCNALKVLDMGNNWIVNRFPYWLANLENLRVLVLKSNMFYGEISDMELKPKGSDSVFPMLKVLDLSTNHFNGTLPRNLFVNLKAMMGISNKSFHNSTFYYTPYVASITYKGQSFDLENTIGIFGYIDLSNNEFLKEIPEEIGELLSLDVVNLSHNALTGPIPSEFANLHQLQLLDLSSNQLSGHIPQELTSLTFLSALNLSYNNLVGEIPEARQFSTFSNASYLGNPGLCGSPLSLQCPTPPSNHGFKKGLPLKSSVDIIGLSISIGLGLGVGFAFVIWATMSWENGRKWFNFIIDRFYIRHFH